MNSTVLRQIGGVMRLELKKTFLSRRGWWIYFLALGPVAITLLHWLVESRMGQRTGRHSIGEDSIIFAGMFLFYYLRAGIFFGCMGIFRPLPRGDAGKDAALLLPDALAARVAGGRQVPGRTGGGGDPLRRQRGAGIFTIGKHFGPAWTDYLVHGPGLSQLGSYVLVTVLASSGIERSS